MTHVKNIMTCGKGKEWQKPPANTRQVPDGRKYYRMRSICFVIVSIRVSLFIGLAM